MLLLARPSPLEASCLCDFLIDDAWQGLRDLIETSYDGSFVMICPFTIAGDGCPPAGEVGYAVPNLNNLYIMCEPYFALLPLRSNARVDGSTGCIIDCPRTHFSVPSLTIDSLTVRGSNKAAIKVQTNASLTVFNSYFQE